MVFLGVWEDAQGMLKGGGLQQEEVMLRDERSTTPGSEGNTSCLSFKDVNSRRWSLEGSHGFCWKIWSTVHSLGRELNDASLFSCQCRKPTEA